MQLLRDLDPLARSLRLVLDGMRRARIGPPATMTTTDVNTSAFGLSYAIRASLWQKRTKAPPWSRIYEDWERKLPPSGVIDESLYGDFHPNDRFRLLTDNREAFSVRDNLYRAAKDSIDIATYYIKADVTSWQTVRPLADCAERGIRLRIVADRTSIASKTFERIEVAGVVSLLRRVGADFRLFHDPVRPFDANHRKLLIVDGETLITGGRNIADHYSGAEWRDSDLLLTGPSVKRALEIFEETFDPRRTPAASRGRSIFQSTTPPAVSSNAGFLYLLQCIRASRHTLDIENAYYINHDVVFRHLADARKRGVRVRIFTNSDESNDLDYTNYRIYAGYPALLDVGVELYLRRGKARTLHCKYFVADGEWVGYGSSNLDYYSPRFCNELGIHARSPELAAMLTRWFEEGIADAQLLRDPAVVHDVLAKQVIGRQFDRFFTDIQ